MANLCTNDVRLASRCADPHCVAGACCSVGGGAVEIDDKGRRKETGRNVKSPVVLEVCEVGGCEAESARFTRYLSC